MICVGSSFIVDDKLGFVAAAHTRMNIGSDAEVPFGGNCYKLSRGKVIICVIPQDTDGNIERITGVVHYFARIVAK